MITPDSPEYKNLTDEGKEAILEQIERVTTACQKVGMLAIQANFDRIYTELCRGRYDEKKELMLFNESDYLAAAFNIREQLDPDIEAQQKADRAAAAREELRVRERAQRLEALDRKDGIDKGWRTKEQIEAEAKEAREKRQQAAEQAAKEREAARAKAALEAATQKEIQENPGRFCPDWKVAEEDADVLRKLPVNVLHYYMKKRTQWLQEQAIAANEAARAARKNK